MDADQLTFDAGNGRLVEELRKLGELTVAASVHASGPYLSHELNRADIDFEPLPTLRSTARGLFKARQCRLVIRRLEDTCDVVIVQVPFASPLALLRRRTPRVYHVVANLPEVVRASTHYSGPRRVAAIASARAIDWLLRRLASKAVVVANGSELGRRYVGRRTFTVISSSLRASDVETVVRRRDQSVGRRVLFVGYLRPEKGVDVLLQAVAQLREDLPDVVLELATAEDLGDRGVTSAIDQMLRDLDAQGAILSCRSLRFGPELFQAYADAHVVVVPSRSEGTPRVLVEARAFGCAVIATSVGGIPDAVTDGVDGLLVLPDDPGAVAEAMRRVFTEPGLLDSLSNNGRERVNHMTVSDFAGSLYDAARLAVDLEQATTVGR